MSTPKGYSTQEKDDRLSAQFQTIEPVRELQYGSTVVSHQFVYEVGTDAAEAGSTAYSIVASAHAALKGDVILLTSGALSGREVKVWEVSANLITLAETLPSAIATSVTFKILRHKYPTVDSTGALITLATEVATAADGGALPAVVKVIGGYDGSAVQVIKTDSDGELQVDVLSSALPTGAATEATLSTLATEASLAGLNSVVATEATLNSINTLVGSLANCVDVAEIQVDVVSSALPTGAATETTLQGVATEATLATLATEATVATLATEATVSTLATEATVSTLATEATVSTLATEATVSTLATEATVSTLATEATVSTLATEATVSTLGTETTLAAIKTAAELIDNAISGNEMQVDVKLIEGVIDANNTTSTPLLAGGNFTGGWTEIKDYNSINLGVFSDVASATDGLRIEYSFDGISVHHFHLWTFPGGANGIGYQLSAEFRYFRINYTNGAAPQATFLLQSNLKPTALFPSSYRASQTFSSQSQVILTKGIIVGETTGGGGGYVAVKVNPSGALTVEADITSSALPTGAATETTLAAIKTAVEIIDNAVSGNELQVDVVTSALPAGAATESTLASIEGDTSSLAGCVSGSEVQVDIVSSALPSGAATEATLADIKTAVELIDNAVSGSELQVDIVAALPSGTNTIGKVDVNTLSVVDLLDAGILDTSSTNIAGSASNPTQVVASTAAATKKLQLLDTTGAFIGVYTGAALSEVLQFVMGPGSDQTIEHAIPAATRISLKRLDSTTAISSGIVAINFIG